MQKQEPAGGTTLDTLQLDGWQLDYFTGLALGYEMLVSNGGVGPGYRADRTTAAFEPTCRPDDLMPVLLKMRTVMKGADGKAAWMARAEGCEDFTRGDSPAVAMCRALVLRKFGKCVRLPGATDCEDLFA